MAQYSATSGAVVDGGTDLQPLEPLRGVGAAAGDGATARRDQAGHGVPRWHHHPGPPESRRCGEKGGSSAQPALPAKRNEAPVACPAWIYHNRNLVERCWNRLKEWRAVATRYEKTERSFMGVLCMAATMDWLKV